MMKSARGAAVCCRGRHAVDGRRPSPRRKPRWPRIATRSAMPSAWTWPMRSRRLRRTWMSRRSSRASATHSPAASPRMGKEEADATDHALRARVAARDGQAGPGATPGAPPPAVDKAKVGQLVGGLMIGPSLAPSRTKSNCRCCCRRCARRSQAASRCCPTAKPRRRWTAFSKRMQDKMQAKAALAGRQEQGRRRGVPRTNKAVKGVFTTPSGLQYRCCARAPARQPKPGDRVRVNYRGTLLDGTVFDSSYDRGAAGRIRPGRGHPRLDARASR